MNRVMREVFPTLCSPKKTSLNLVPRASAPQTLLRAIQTTHFLRAA